MDDFNAPPGDGPPLQGPHWHTTRPPRQAPAVAPLRLILRGTTQVIQIVQTEVVIGRHSRADVRLPLPDVSRQHCRLSFGSGRWHVRDLDSLNGLYVNGLRVTEAELQHQDTLRIGGLTFTVELVPAASETAHYGEEAALDRASVLRSIADRLPPADEAGPQRLAS